MNLFDRNIENILEIFALNEQDMQVQERLSTKTRKKWFHRMRCIRACDSNEISVEENIFM